MNWEIIDDNGVIHSGSEMEMTYAFDVMTNPDEHSNDENDGYPSQWEGDLKLVHVINICR